MSGRVLLATIRLLPRLSLPLTAAVGFVTLVRPLVWLGSCSPSAGSSAGCPQRSGESRTPGS